MTNEELLIKLKEINETPNLCDQIIALKKFQKEYRKSDFFKATKMPLFALAKEYQTKAFFTFESLLNGLQKVLNELDAEKLTAVIDHFSSLSREDFENMVAQTKESGFADIMGYFRKEE